LLGALFNRLGFHPTFEKWIVVQVKLNEWWTSYGGVGLSLRGRIFSFVKVNVA
jgi:hypothetical protein